MIKTLACRKVESTALSNRAVNPDHTTMNQVHRQFLASFAISPLPWVPGLGGALLGLRQSVGR